jgi:hypothetical protein
MHAQGVTSGDGGDILIDAAQGDIEGGPDRDVLGVGLVGGGEDLQQALFGNHLDIPFPRRASGEVSRAGP